MFDSNGALLWGVEGPGTRCRQLALAPGGGSIAGGAVLVLAGERLTAIDAGSLCEGPRVARPPAAVLAIPPVDTSNKQAAAARSADVDSRAVAELVGKFGNVMISTGPAREVEARAFNWMVDAWFAKHPGESVGTLAMRIATAVAAKNPGTTVEGVYPMVFGDLVRVRAGWSAPCRRSSSAARCSLAATSSKRRSPRGTP